ncbi:oligosaccharide flippase family protein [Wenyingzhuangia sp. IMCC45533]
MLKQKFVTNTLSLFSIKGLELIFTIWVVPFLLTKIGIDNYGVYAFGISLVLFFTNVLNYGFNLSTVRDLAKADEDKSMISKLFNEVINVRFYLFVFSYLIIVLILILVPKFDPHKKVYVFSSFILLGHFFSLRWFFLGLEKMIVYLILSLLSTLSFAILLSLLLSNETPLYYVPLFEAISLIVINFFGFVYVLRVYKIKLYALHPIKVLNYLKNNIDSFINLLLPSIYNNIIVFLVGMFGLPSDVTFVQIGLKLTNMFTTINAILTKAFYPIVNRNRTAFSLVRTLMIVVGTGFSLIMFFMSEWIVTVWLNKHSIKEYQNITLVIKLMSAIPFLMSIISIYGVNGILVFQKDKLYRNITLISTLMMVISILILLPIYGYIGAAVSLVVSRLVYSFLSYHYYIDLKRNEFVN